MEKPPIHRDVEEGLEDYRLKKEEKENPSGVAWDMEEVVNPTRTNEYYEQKRYLLLHNPEISEDIKSTLEKLTGDELHILGKMTEDAIEADKNMTNEDREIVHDLINRGYVISSPGHIPQPTREIDDLIRLMHKQK